MFLLRNINIWLFLFHSGSHICVYFFCKSIKYKNSWPLQTFRDGIFILISQKITWVEKRKKETEVDLVRSSTLKYNRKLSYFPLKWWQKGRKKLWGNILKRAWNYVHILILHMWAEWCQNMWKKQRHLIKQSLIQYTQQLTPLSILLWIIYMWHV